MSRSRPFLFGFCTVLMLLFTSVQGVHAQNLSNEKIQVAADALTVLKFNSEITHCELGMRDGFTCLVRDNDNTVVIKTLEPIPASTNLAITEGRRTHYFVLVFLKKVDINNTKLFYDYSDLKTLKKLVKKAAEASPETVAIVHDIPEAAVKDVPPVKKSKKEEAAERKQREAEQKKVDEELARQEKLEREKALAYQNELQRQKDLAATQEAEKQRAAEEKIRLAKEAKEAAALAKAKAAEEKKQDAANKAAAKAAAKAKAEEDKRLASTKKPVETPAPEPVKVAPEPVTAAAKTEEPKKLSRREERALRKKQEEEAALAAAKAEELRKQEEAALAAKERARVEELERLEAIAAEKERVKEEALQKQKDAIAAKAAAKEEAKRKKQELADAAEAKKKEAQQKAASKPAVPALDMSMMALRKRYPTINFADIPEGQMITGEYFIPVDTQENYAQCMKTLNEEPCLGITSAPVEGVDMRLEDVNFSGVNAYLRIHVRNHSKKEYLVGRMLLRWDKAEGGGYNLFACYVTGFPVIPPGGEMKLVFVARGVNAHDEDMMYFRMTDRVREGNTIEIPFTGKMYNDEMTRK